MIADESDDATAERALVRRAASGESVTLSIDTLPRLRRAAECVVPLFGSCDEYPEYPFSIGTAFWLSYERHRILVTAAHCVEEHFEHTTRTELFVSDRRLGEQNFGPGEGFVQLSKVEMPAKVHRARADEYDVAVAYCENGTGSSVEPLFFEPQSAFAVPETPLGTPLVVTGFPCDAESKAHYDERTLHRNRFSFIGTYRGMRNVANRLHTMAVDTTLACVDGRPGGLSGSPVFQLGLDHEREQFTHALVGMVVRAGPDAAHFVDVDRIATTLRDCVPRLSSRSARHQRRARS